MGTEGCSYDHLRTKYNIPCGKAIFSLLDEESVEWYNDFHKYAIMSNYGELCMKWKEKLARYAPRLGLLLISMFVLIGSATVAIGQRQQYRRDTFDVYLADTAAARAVRREQMEAIPAVQTEEQPIYAAPSGKRYHNDPRCPGKNGCQITWEEAAERGLTPCKKCVK